jgi:hypothetical protein
MKDKDPIGDTITIGFVIYVLAASILILVVAYNVLVKGLQ